MVNEEIYVLTKHARFQADYVEKLPIYRRRHFLHLLQKENDEIQKQQDAMNAKINRGRK
jgi:hypothetical protein